MKPAATDRVLHLRWSEHCYLFACGLAALQAVDPFGWQLNNVSAIKHLPFLLTLPALILSVIGRNLALPPEEKVGLANMFAIAWPFLLLALVIIGGSLYVRVVNGVETTFLTAGVYMGLTFVAAAMLVSSESPARLMRAYCRILLIAALLMSAYLVLNFRVREVYHEQIFLLVPMGVFCMLALRNAAAAWGGLLFFLVMAFFSAKNTSYLVALFVVIYLAILLWLPRFKSAPPLTRIGVYYLGFVALLITAVGVLFLLYYRHEYLPSGNVEYRSHTYALAWQQFLDSPLWGTLFAAESVRKFTLYTIGIAGNRLPTHSDVMDLLANGGALGIALWSIGLVRIGRVAYGNLLSVRHRAHPLAKYGHTMAALSLAGILTYSFNPIMLQPGMAYLLWTNLGFLLGLAMRTRMQAGLSERNSHSMSAQAPMEAGRLQPRGYSP